jgi:CRP-like cAMP-binding protein
LNQPVPPGIVSEWLKRVPLFQGLQDEELEHLAGVMHELAFERGSVLVREGERGARVAAFFVLLDGEVLATKGEQEIGRRGPGDYIGEIALLRDMPRTATVTAVTQVRCLALSAWEFRRFVDANPQVAWALLEAIAVPLDEL